MWPVRPAFNARWPGRQLVVLRSRQEGAGTPVQLRIDRLVGSDFYACSLLFCSARPGDDVALFQRNVSCVNGIMCSTKGWKTLWPQWNILVAVWTLCNPTVEPPDWSASFHPRGSTGFTVRTILFLTPSWNNHQWFSQKISKICSLMHVHIY